MPAPRLLHLWAPCPLKASQHFFLPKSRMILTLNPLDLVTLPDWQQLVFEVIAGKKALPKMHLIPVEHGQKNK